MNRLVFLALLVASVAGCGSRSDLPIHLVDDPKVRRDDPFVKWGDVVFLGNVPRKVLSSAATVMPPSEVLPQPEGPRKVRAQIPPSFRALPWLLFETVATRGDTMRKLRSWPVTAKQAGTTYEVFVTETKIKPDETPAIRLWPIPDLASRDVETGDYVIPSHAALELGVGLEPISVDSSFFPIDMTVSAVAADGTSTPLRTIQLNPRDKAHQKWVDATIPLDVVAGQRVRFRFTARATMGSMAAASLPLWADPTIVDAAPTAGASS
jgi:hypothetical protein